MSRIIAILMIGSLLAFGTVQAQDLVNVGPTSMPVTEFTALYKMVNGQEVDRQAVTDTRPDKMVDVGMASMSLNDFETLTALLDGGVIVDQVSFASREAMVDIGVASFRESEFNSLNEMVRNGEPYRLFKERRADFNAFLKR